MSRIRCFLLLILLVLTGCSFSDTNASVNSKAGLTKCSSSNSSASSMASAESSSKTTRTTSGFLSEGQLSENTSSYIKAFDPEEQKRIVAVLKKTSSVSDYHSLITNKMQNAEVFFKQYFFYCYVGQSNFFTISYIDTKFPIFCLRRVGDQIYSIYETNDGLIYVYYDHSCKESHCVYMCKKLSSDSFKEVDVGTSLSAVEKIDPAATVWANHAVPIKKSQFFSDHLLTDGLLKLTYTRQANGKYLVSEKYFSRNFHYPENTAPINYNYTILPEDYIH